MDRTMGAARLAWRALVVVALTASVLALVALGLGPRTGAYRTLTVLSGSMRPLIGPGDVVVVVPRPAETLRVGDVIAFHAPIADRRVVTHRVVRIVKDGPHPVIATKGDANAAEDPWTAQVNGNTVWKVRAVVPVVGHLIATLRGRATHIALVIVVPLLLALLWLRDVWHEPAPVSGIPRVMPAGGGAKRHVA